MAKATLVVALLGAALAVSSAQSITTCVGQKPGLYKMGEDGGGSGTASFVIAANNDDAEQRISNGAMDLTSSDLEFTYDGSNDQILGMRFTNVQIPNGATVKQAYIQFTVDETKGGTAAVTLRIRGEKSANAAAITSTSSHFSSRISSIGVTTATVEWVPPSWTTVNNRGPDQRTSDISSIINEIMAVSGWQSGNALLIYVDKIVSSSSALRCAGARDNGANVAPALVVEYTTASTAIDVYCHNDHTLIMKMAAGDTLQYSSPLWTTTQTLNPSDLTLTPGDAKFDTFNLLPFRSIMACIGSPFENCISHSFQTPIANALELFQGPHRAEGVIRDEFMAAFKPSGHRVCSRIQHPGFNVQCRDNNFARWGFCNNVPSQECQPGAGQDTDAVIGIGISGQDCCPAGAGWTNHFVSNVANGGMQQQLPAWLWITEAAYQPSCLGAAGPTVKLEFPIINNADDGEEQEPNGNMYLTSSDLELPYDGSTRQVTGVRFQQVQIAKNQVAKRVYLQFTVDELKGTNGAPLKLRIRGERAGNSNAFLTTAWNMRDRPRTTASVDWEPPYWPTTNVQGPDQQTPDISSIVNEITSLDAWVLGNAMTIFVEPLEGGSSGTRSCKARESGGEERGPRLVVEIEGAKEGEIMLKTPGSSGAPSRVYCVEDFALVMKMKAGSDVLGYESKYWSTMDLLNPEQNGPEPGDVKIGLFNTMTVRKIRGCVGTPTNCVEHEFDFPIANALTLFTGSYRREGIVQSQWESVFKVTGHRPCEDVQLPGFNTVCRDNNLARWGYCHNIPSQACQLNDGDDADGIIGFGIRGQDCCPAGAGWTNHFVDNVANNGKNSQQNGYIFVSDLSKKTITDCKDQTEGIYMMTAGGKSFPVYCRAGWALIMKTLDDATFGYESPYWTTDDLLNAAQLSAQPGSAKFEAYNRLSFNSVRGCVMEPDNCITVMLDKTYTKASELFNSPTPVMLGGGMAAFTRVIAPVGHTSCDTLTAGFNVKDNKNNKARWGYLGLRPSAAACRQTASQDVDAAMGFGVAGSDCCAAGAGWTNLLVSNTAEAGLNAQLVSWLWVGTFTLRSQLQTVTSCLDKSPGRYMLNGVETYCDGDWALVMKVAKDDTFRYESPLWDQDAPFNADGPIDLLPGNVKLGTYATLPFKTVRMCVNSATTNCVYGHFDTPRESFKSLVAPANNAYTRQEFAQEEWWEVFNPVGAKVCPQLQLPGFNLRCVNDNWARWGFCNNIPSQQCQPGDTEDADAPVGLGLKTQDCCAMGAGYSNYFVQDTANNGFEQRMNAWVWVSDLAVVKSCYGKPDGAYVIRPDVVHYKGAAFTGYCAGGWMLVMKIAADATFSYDAPYWTTDLLLNDDILNLEPANAKYAAFNRAPFRRIKGCVGDTWAQASQKCIYADLGRTFDSAKAIFSSPYTRSNANKDEWYGTFPVTGHRVCDVLQQPGFNTKCRDSNHARWGFCHNVPGQACQPLPTDDADGVLGFGLTGQDCCPTGAGYTNYFVSDTANNGMQKSFQAYLLVSMCDDTYPCPPSNYLASCGADEATPVCMPCPAVPHCAGSVECTAATLSKPSCSECAPGYFWNGEACDSCALHCPELDDQCGGHVLCTSEGQCTGCGCAPGQYEAASVCRNCTLIADCVANELSCTTNRNSRCESCAAGFFRVVGSSQQVADTCMACSVAPDDKCFQYAACTNPGRGTDAACEVAQPGYYVNQEGAVLPCDPVPNCAGQVTCAQDTSSTCSQCNTGYYLSMGRCTACRQLSDFSNCKAVSTCSGSEDTRCISCDTGYTIVGSSCAPTSCSVDALPVPANATKLDGACNNLTCYFQCNSGHVTTSNPCECTVNIGADRLLLATCSIDGQWRPDPDRCVVPADLCEDDACNEEEPTTPPPGTGGDGSGDGNNNSGGSSSSSDNDTNTGLIIGLVILAVLVVILIIALIANRRRKQRGAYVVNDTPAAKGDAEATGEAGGEQNPAFQGDDDF